MSFNFNGIPQESFTLNLALDRAGQVKNLTYPSCTGGACGSSGPTGRTVSAEYQKGFLSKVPGFIDQPISYHANGMFWQRRHANGMRVDQHIDSTTMMGRPQQINVFDVNNSPLGYSGTYDYDGSGNIKAKGSAFRYRYDGVSRLVESRETWGATTYVQKPTFDSYGNIQSMETGPSGATTLLNTPTSASTNRLTSAGTVYDPVGNMTSWNGGAQYDYDRLNRIRRFRGSPTPGSEEWVFAYTASDERVLSLRVGGSGRIWSLRGLDGTLLREWRSESSVQSFKDYIWTGRHLVAKVERTPNQGALGGAWTETTIHAATDHLGTVRTYTDAAGLALPGHIYYPFGKQLNGTQDGERIKYTGHERDMWNTPSSADDLDYMHARHYNPQIARFLQIDPLRGATRMPQTLNRYSYVAGNPVSFNDPSGMMLAVCSWQAVDRSEVWNPGGTLDITIYMQMVCVTNGGAPSDNTGLDGPGGPEGPGRWPPGPPGDNNDDDDEDDDGDGDGDDPTEGTPNDDFELSPFEEWLSDLDIDGLDYANCIAENRLDWGGTAYAIGNPIANALAGDTGRSGFNSPRHPTSWQHKAGAWASRRTGWIGFSRAGKFVGRASILLTVFEGFFDIGTMAGCAVATN